MADIFTKRFHTLANPRQSAKVSYPLIDILVLTACLVTLQLRDLDSKVM